MPTDAERIGFVEATYGKELAFRMSRYFFEREPRDDAERGFVWSVRRSIDREMAASNQDKGEGE